MNRAIPWVIAVVALIAFGASFSELHKARDRYWELAGVQSRDHLHREAREFMIRAAIAETDQPIVVFGDSVTEMARLPETIGGRPPSMPGLAVLPSPILKPSPRYC
jgi:hypothetical protein